MSTLERELKKAARGRAEASAPPAAESLAARAGDAKLIDVAYAHVDSPIGPLIAATTRRGLVRIGFLPGYPEDEMLEQLAETVSPRVLEAPERLDEVRHELDEYFEGGRTDFGLRLDWRLVRGFHRDVLRATSRIPYGRTLSYAEVAERAGSPRAYRAAGNALHRNPIPIVIPCHRVLHSTGGLGGYGGGLDVKRHLLELEHAL